MPARHPLRNVLACGLAALCWIVPVAAQDPPGAGRTLELREDTDYQGRDIRILKDVELDACKAACLDEPACRAFTYNGRARWCFLKAEAREPRTFRGAVSGRIAEGTADADPSARRAAELGFLPGEELAAARQLAAGLADLAAKDKRGARELDEAVRAALGQGDGERAVALAAARARLTPERSAPWLALSRALAAAQPRDWELRNRRQAQAAAAAVNGYLRATDEAQRAEALTQVSRTLAARQRWLPAIRALRAAVALGDDQQLRAEYRRLVDEQGFRILEHRVDADSPTPRICLDFSEPLARTRANIADFVRVPDDPRLPVEVEERQVCVDGVVHGGTYRLEIREGLPAANGERLEKTVELSVRVGDRTPSVRFSGRAYVLPRGGEASIPVVSVNASLLAASVYRIGDRSIAQALRDGPFLEQIEAWRAGQIARESGERVFSGTVDVEASLNRDITTAVPVGALVPELRPGVYALTAHPRRTLTRAADPACEEETCPGSATQWFVVSDLGLTTLTGNDGLHVLVRSLGTAAPLPGAALTLIARNNEVLGEATTDAGGYARFEPGLLRGTGGNTPQLVTARLEGDYGFLDLARAPFDLSDRGVEGRPAPRPIDVFLTPERGVYRPGETVHLTALVRDSRARAVTDLPLTLIVRRPDGLERTRLTSTDQGQGGHQAALPLPPSAQRGAWRVAAHADPKGEALAQATFLVEDFVPERIDFALAAPAGALDPGAPSERVAIDARFLYGAPASNVRVEGETLVRPAAGIPGFAGFRFGLAADQPEPALRQLPPGTTDAEGRAQVPIELPDPIATSRALEAELHVRVADPGGRPVERTLTLPVLDGQPRVGVRPLFDDAAPEGGAAAFEVIALGPDRARRAAPVAWTLDRVEKTFQWYRDPEGNFDYEPVERTRRVSSGTLDLSAADPGRIEVPVEWGGYRLTLESAGLLPASVDFDAGWYSAPKAADTPDQLRLSLDRPAYRIGERARVRIEPRGPGGVPGVALVMVVDDRLIAMQAVEVPPEGTTIELPVTPEWGPGAYVTAALYHPMDIDARRMPARALGLAWAAVDPQQRRLQVEIGRPETTRPRTPMTVEVSVPNAPAGGQVFVTLAAVDSGILNLTNFKPPAPDAWYFGQRRLGSEIRDLYGALIDRMQGGPGVVRSGGDGGLLRRDAPPPSEELMAFHSGILPLGPDGRARIDVPVVDFNGSVRLMAMAWSADGVGSAAAETLARDPVVVTAALPRFLAPGDRSRLLVTLTPVEETGGEARLAVGAAKGLVALGTEERPLALAGGQRTEVSVPVEALSVGDETLSLSLSTAGGTSLTRRVTLPVRGNAPAMRVTEAETLAPGGDGLLLTGDLLDGAVPGSGSLRVSVSRARLDVAGLLHALDRFPYGCTEQVTSRALPLLYFDETALAAGLAGDPAVAPRLRDAVDRVIANAGAEGSFSLWGPGYGELWLDAYVTDFLTRARELGHPVPAAPFEAALDNLRNRTAYASPGPADAYALYVLARNGRASIGDLRWLADERLGDLGTPAAMAQVGAALALYGDNARADRALAAAAAALDADAPAGRADDFGSPLRDAAAVLALSAEVGSRSVDRQALAGRVRELLAARGHTSTQEQAWLLLAAHALGRAGSDLRLEVDGMPVAGAWYGSFDADRLEASPVLIRNVGDAPVEALVTLTGVPREAPPAGGSGYRIERAFYDLDGRRTDLAGVSQGRRLVAVLTVRADAPRAGRLIVDDPLPAGFEIDNPSLLRSADLKALAGVSLTEATAHHELRSDRFIAAVDRGADDPAEFQLGYLIRAVTPGTFAHPPALVEDMYAPDYRGWSDAGTAAVLGVVE